MPKYITKLLHDTVRIPAHIDTLAILNEYYSKYKIIDTLKLFYSKTDNRQFGYGIITDTISMNKILHRFIEWDYQIPTIEKTITEYPAPKNQVYFGFNTAFNSVTFIDHIGLGLILKNKKDRIYQLNGGISNKNGGLQPFIGAGIYWKISFQQLKK